MIANAVEGESVTCNHARVGPSISEGQEPVGIIVSVNGSGAVRVGGSGQVTPVVVRVSDNAAQPISQRSHSVQHVEAVLDNLVTWIREVHAIAIWVVIAG